MLITHMVDFAQSLHSLSPDLSALRRRESRQAHYQYGYMSQLGHARNPDSPVPLH